MVKWKVYYDNEETFSDLDGSPYDAPAVGVLVIIQEDKEHGWHSVCGKDYYILDNRGTELKWWCVDHFGLYDYLIQKGAKRVLFGREVENTLFSKIYEKASKDVYFLAKTAFKSKERKPETSSPASPA